MSALSVDRGVDLAAPVIDAIRDWTRSRPNTTTDHVFLSLPRNRAPGPLKPRVVNSLVETYATQAGLPEDRRTPHVLRHTFCTLLADAGAGLEVVAELAGHADLRTTKGYVTVSPTRRATAVHETPKTASSSAPGTKARAPMWRGSYDQSVAMTSGGISTVGSADSRQAPSARACASSLVARCLAKTADDGRRLAGLQRDRNELAISDSDFDAAADQAGSSD